MTMPKARPASRGRAWPVLLRALATAALGAAAALPISCAGSGAGLIPAGNAGPLQRDFAAVAEAAQKGNGSCSGTETAIARTEQDYRALPGTINQGLRGRLREGIEKLREDALQQCLQPLVQNTSTSTSAPRTAPTTTVPTGTQTTPTQTSPTTSTSTTTPENGGGTPAPGGEPPSEGGAAGAGGAGEGDGGGNGGKGGKGKDGNGGPGGAGPEGGK
jgi:hypothetical protein